MQNHRVLGESMIGLRALVPALLFMAACNEPPGMAQVVISPSIPGTDKDLVATIAADAPDSNGDAISYSYSWFEDGEVRSDLSGATVTSSETSKGETWLVVVVASDGELEGPPSSDEVVVINSAPTVEVAIEPLQPTSEDQLVATVTSQDSDGDFVEVTLVWKVDGAMADVDGETVPAEFTSAGQVWELTAMPTDGSTAGTSASASVAIDNAPPVISSVSLEPDPAYEGTEIDADVDVSDLDGDAISLHYVWAVDGSVVLEGEQASLSGDWFDKHQTVQVEVTPSDGFTDGLTVSSAILTIANTPPTIAEVLLSPEDVFGSSEVSCTASGWSDDDGDSGSYLYSWTADGTEISTGVTIDGALFARGEALVCTVVPWDGEDEGSGVSGSTTVLNSAPSISSVTLSSGSPMAVDTLEAIVTGAEDADGDAVSYAYAWTISGAVVSTDATLSSPYFTKGDEIRVEVTPTDGSDDGVALTSDVAIAINSPPVISAVSLVPASPITSDTVVAAAAVSDADGDSISMSYLWYVDSSLISATGVSLDGELWFERGQVIQAVVTPSDDEEQGAAVSSSAATVANSPPTAPSLDFEPSSPTDEEDLICVLDQASTDLDGDSIDYGFAWTVDDAAYSGAITTTHSGDTVPAIATAATEQWACTVTPDDGSDAGTSTTVSATLHAPFNGWPSQTNSLSIADTLLYGDNANDMAGQSLDGGRDVDGDGLPELLIGAWNTDSGGASSGSAYLVYGADIGSSGSLDLGSDAVELIGAAAGDSAGICVSFAGDVDGDGFEDLLIGAYANDTGASYGGVVHIVLGASVASSGTMSLASADYTLIGENTFDFAGYSVSTAGDVDGDGLDDVLVGADDSARNGDDAGAVYLVLGASLGGSASIDLGTADSILVGEAEDDSAQNAGAPGDVDGDGLDDVLVGAVGNDDGGSWAGKVYLVHADSLSSGGTFMLSSADLKFVGEDANSRAGTAFGRGGDVDGDGAPDLLISGYRDDEVAYDAGKVWVLLNSSLAAGGSTDLSMADYTMLGEGTTNNAGVDVAYAGDVDGDALDDILIGSYNSEASSNAGKAYLVLGGSLGGDASFSLADADYGFTGTASLTYAGHGVAGAGDMNQDGLMDLLVGGFGISTGGTYAGGAYLLLTP